MSQFIINKKIKLHISIEEKIVNKIIFSFLLKIFDNQSKGLDDKKY